MKKGVSRLLLYYVAIFLIASILIVFIAIPNDVNYFAELKEDKIQQGETLVVFYTLKNGLSETKKMKFTYYIEGKEGLGLIDYKEVPIEPGKEFRGNASINTGILNSGKYTVKTYIEYYIPEVYIEENKHSKDKDLEFEIF